MSVSDIYRAIATSQGTGSIDRASRPNETSPEKSVGKPDGMSFRGEFKKALDTQLNLSTHAETRIRSRSIPWDAAMEKRIAGGIEAARAKGSREALILADNVAVIANVKSNTVVTAMDRSQMKEKIFTNIDSAVIV